jgi:hypothetical protein
MINDNKRDTSSWLRSLYNYTMGVLWIGVGVFILFHKKWGYDLELRPALGEIFGVSSILYGLFRVYRGYKNQ